MTNEQIRFDIHRLRSDVSTGRRPLRITTHAQTEAFKDGLLLADLRYVFEQGEVIETYPDDVRGLLYAQLPDPVVPVHIVIEETLDEGVIITAYIPDKRRWIRDRKRRK